MAGVPPLIRIDGVTKRFGSVAAVDRLSLDIAAGEFFALLGPSGCGKTTLMRLIAGFETPDEGRIFIDDQDVTDVPPHRRPVNMMFQSYALFPHMNVARNIGFGLVQAGLPKDEIAARVAEMLRLVQLVGFETRRPDQLSGGQRQRVALARALARRPRLLLLDEPLAALDRKLRQDTQFELMHLQRTLGTSFVLVTHDQDEAMIMADRMAVMRAGAIAQLDTPRAVYADPVTRWVAGFIGEINLFESTVETREGAHDYRLRSLADAAQLFTVASTAELNVGQKVAVAVRPEALTLDGEAKNTANLLLGEVVETAFRGGDCLVRARLAWGQVVLASVSGTAAERIVRGQPITLSFAPSAARVLTA